MPKAKKFTKANIGDRVYSSALGPGVIIHKDDRKIVVKHERGMAQYTLEGRGTQGALHWWGKPAS